ncbi:MAG TPA: response regulator [Nitrospirae bacterium]|nr:response regulator [Nitrospirota bacterium]
MKLRLLIAEDNQLIQQLFKDGLPEGVFEKKFVKDGKEAIQAYLEWKPHIIILDYMIPVMNGLKVLKEIRQTYNDTSTVIIMSTFMDTAEYKKRCELLGIQGFLPKPFRIRDLIALMIDYYRGANSEIAEFIEKSFKKKG